LLHYFLLFVSFPSCRGQPPLLWDFFPLLAPPCLPLFEPTTSFLFYHHGSSRIKIRGQFLPTLTPPSSPLLSESVLSLGWLPKLGSVRPMNYKSLLTSPTPRTSPLTITPTGAFWALLRRCHHSFPSLPYEFLPSPFTSFTTTAGFCANKYLCPPLGLFPIL